MCTEHFPFTNNHLLSENRLNFQDISEYPLIEPLKSYGRGRDAPGGRYISLVFGTNLTDVVITGTDMEFDFTFVYA